MKKLKLDDIDKAQHPFKVPEGYFDELKHSILEKKESEPTKVIFWTPGVKMAIAAAFSLIAVVSVLLNINTDDEKPVDLLADISNEEIILYLASYELSEEELTEGLGDDLTFEWEHVEPLDDMDDLDIDESFLDEFNYDIEMHQDI